MQGTRLCKSLDKAVEIPASLSPAAHHQTLTAYLPNQLVQLLKPALQRTSLVACCPMKPLVQLGKSPLVLSSK